MTPSSRHPKDHPAEPGPEANNGNGAADAHQARPKPAPPPTDTSSSDARLEDQRQQYLRLAADFDNFRRRSSQEAADRTRYASADAARALLPVLDNLERAVEQAGEGSNGTALLDGVRMVLRQFDEALRALGLSPIPTLGEPFDPTLHEAIAGEERSDVDRDTVVDELQRGWRLHDRVLRPAQVRVAHPASTNSE
jgi:molecular chaperone GrpE